MLTYAGVCKVDEALEECSFDALYREYEVLLREKMDGSVNKVLRMLTYASVC